MSVGTGRQAGEPFRLSVVQRGWLALVVFLLAVQQFPLTGERVFQYSGVIASRYYLKESYHGYLHGRPTEWCSTYARQFAAWTDASRNILQGDGGWRRLAEADRLEQEFYRAGCEGEWALHDDWLVQGRMVVYFAPFAWVQSQFGIGMATITTLLLVGSWLGMVALLLLGWELTRSTLVALAGVGVAFWLLRAGYYPKTSPLLFIPLWAGVTLARRSLIDGSGWLVLSTLAVTLAATTLPLFFLFPSFHRVVPLVVGLSLLLVGGLARRWRPVLAGGLVLAACHVVTLPFDHFSSALDMPNVALRTAQGSQAVKMYWVANIYDYPNVYGFPFRDWAFETIFMQDPLLTEHGTGLRFHHGVAGWVARYFPDLMTENLSQYLLAVWQRFVSNIIFIDRHSFGLMQGPVLYYFYYPALAVFMLVLAGLFVSPPAWLHYWPLVAVIYWELFGITTLFSNIHEYNWYIQHGLFLLPCFSPALLFFLLAGLGRWRRTRVVRRRYLWAGGAVVAVAGGVLLPVLIKHVRMELVTFPLRHNVTCRSLLAPDFVMKQLSALQELGEGDGSFFIHSAWLLAHHRWYWNYCDDMQEKQGQARRHDQAVAASRGEIDRLYAEGLQRAPDNPYFPIYARFIGYAAWPAVFRQALQRFPHHPASAFFAYHLLQEGGMEGAAGQGLRTLFVTAQQRLWRDSRVHRPGYQPWPPLIQSPGVHVEHHAQGWKVTLPAGAFLTTQPQPIHRSEEVSALFYLEPLQGGVTSRLALSGHPSGAGLSLQPNPGQLPFHKLALQGVQGDGTLTLTVTAGEGGASFLFGDYYPLLLRAKNGLAW